MTSRAVAHCSRCAACVEIVKPWAGFLWLRRAWFAGLCLLLLLMPIILSEITILLPMAMLFAVAGGPLYFLAAQEATCARCGAVVNLKAKAGSPQTP